MTLFLLMLLAGISLSITLVGYLLTDRSQPPESRPRAAYPADRYVTLSKRRPTSLDPRAARQRSVAYVESHGTWSEFLQSLFDSRVVRRRDNGPRPWAGVTLVLLSLFLLGIFLLHTFMPNATLIGAASWLTSTPAQSNKSSPAPVYTATAALIRLSQLDHSQYFSSQEWDTWAYSACSSASMTEVINAYGHRYRITDILRVEAAIGEITPQLGLLEDAGIANTVVRFGFKTSWGHNLSLDQIIDIANHGRPVIVSFPPQLYDGGHLLVVLGGNSQAVHLADSSLWNRQNLTRSQFLKWWGGFYAIVTPK